MKRRSESPSGGHQSLVDNSSRKRRYETPSQHAECWLGTRARSNSNAVVVSNHSKALNASNASFGSLTMSPMEYDQKSKEMSPAMSLKRKAAIEYLFVHIYDSPIDLNSVQNTIMTLLKIPKGSWKSVRNIFGCIWLLRLGGRHHVQRLNVDIPS